MTDKTKVTQDIQGLMSRVQGFYKSFKIEFDFTTKPMSLSETMAFVDSLEAAGFLGTTFERKSPTENVDYVGKFGKVDSVEKTSTKNGKDAFIAHIKLEENPDAKPIAVMFFHPGAVRKGDRVVMSKNDNGFPAFALVDDKGEKVPF